MKLDKIAKKDSIKVCEFMFRSCLSGQVCTKVCVIKYEKATNTQTHTFFYHVGNFPLTSVVCIKVRFNGRLLVLSNDIKPNLKILIKTFIK